MTMEAQHNADQQILEGLSEGLDGMEINRLVGQHMDLIKWRAEGRPPGFDLVVETRVQRVVAEYLAGQYSSIKSADHLRRIINDEIDQPALADKIKQRDYWRSEAGRQETNAKLAARKHKHIKRAFCP